MAKSPNACKCGNEQGQPLVSPRPSSFIDMETKKPVALRYMAGMQTLEDGTRQCWFCTRSMAWLTKPSPIKRLVAHGDAGN